MSSFFHRGHWHFIFISAVLYVVTIATNVLSQDFSPIALADEGSEIVSYRGPAIEAGFLFVDGVYYAPPYAYEFDGEVASLRIQNAKSIALPMSNRKATRDKGRSRMDRPDDRDRGEDSEWARRFETALATNKAVVIWSSQSAAIIDGYRQSMFLSWLLESKRAAILKDSPPEWLPPEQDTVSWSKAFSEFQASKEFHSRARLAIGKVAAAIEAEAHHRSAKLLFDYASYPLLALSMLTIAITMGHLMGCHSSLVKDASDSGDASVRRDVLWCIALIGSFATIDLVWTVLAAQAGQIHELNPIARQLMSNPYTLASFKLVTTTSALLILYRWRLRRFARQATWWSCLVCMMVAVRWVLQTGII